MDKRKIDRLDLETRVTDLVVRLTILGILIFWSLSLLRPFLPIIIWAVILTVSLYPFYIWLKKTLGGRSKIAAMGVTLLVFLVILGPVAALVFNLSETVQKIASSIGNGTFLIPLPPTKVAAWPIVGEQVHALWILAATNLEEALRRYGSFLLPAGETVLVAVSSVGLEVFRFVLAVVLAGFLFGPGHDLATGGKRFASRIMAPRGAAFVDMAGATIRSVSRGVVGVALLQAILAGVVFQVSGVPGPGLLAFCVLVLCIIQIGPFLVLLPVLIWGWSTMSTGPSLALTVAMVAIAAMDSFLKPLVMGRGLKTPMIVIFLGVIGGTLTYGLIGLFLGPIVLAVFYDLVIVWTRFEPSGSAEERGSAVESPNRSLG